MHLTRESEYALRGLAYLACRDSHDVVPLAEIATAQELPRTFLAKIFQKLMPHGFLTAQRGRGSGYALAKPASEITMRQIFEAVEGHQLRQQCLMWRQQCSDDEPCPLHDHVKDMVPQLEWILEQITLADYVAELETRV
jgi:Rrf2 family protein